MEPLAPGTDLGLRFSRRGCPKAKSAVVEIGAKVDLGGGEEDSAKSATIDRPARPQCRSRRWFVWGKSLFCPLGVGARL